MNRTTSVSKPSSDKPTVGSPMLRTRVKICGITNIDDALEAVYAGADALGFVFYEKSSRAIAAKQAAEIIEQLPPFVSVVGLFVDPEEQAVSEILNVARLDTLQFHGDESAAFAEQFGKPYYTVIRVDGSSENVGQGNADDEHGEAFKKISEHRFARGFLFDTFDQNQQGGTGKSFDWSLFDASVRGAILAGGLHSENVSEAIIQTRPYAVDVSTGVEVSPGRKSAERMRAFVAACRHADASSPSNSFREK